MKTIPPSVLKMLEQQWKGSEGHSMFEEIFTGPRYERRQRDPSFYIYRPDGEASLNELSHDEVKRLDADGALGGHVRHHERHVSVNEHAEHALTDFCKEVYDAWERYQARLERIP